MSTTATQGLIEDFIEMSEGLSESSYTCVVVFPREKKEEILPFITEESSGQETVEGIQEPIIQPIPINLYPGAFAQPQNSPLLVYILPTPAEKSKPAAPAPKAHACAKFQEISGHYTDLCHYIKNDGSRTYRMA